MTSFSLHFFDQNLIQKRYLHSNWSNRVISQAFTRVTTGFVRALFQEGQKEKLR
jgi:hypothetical protein